MARTEAVKVVLLQRNCNNWKRCLNTVLWNGEFWTSALWRWSNTANRIFKISKLLKIQRESFYLNKHTSTANTDLAGSTNAFSWWETSSWSEMIMATETNSVHFYIIRDAQWYTYKNHIIFCESVFTTSVLARTGTGRIIIICRKK